MMKGSMVIAKSVVLAKEVMARATEVEAPAVKATIKKTPKNLPADA
jgi:hypothetical protein